MSRARLLRRLAWATLVVTLASCGGPREDPILQLSSTEALAEGRKLMAEKKWSVARRYFIHAFEVEPNSATGREGLLLAADAHFMSGGEDNLVKAEARYRDFVNRFPTSEHAAYAQFQIGLALSRRIVKPDRDQAVAKQALQALEDVERFYPTSTYAADAAGEIDKVRGNLATHDFVVARFYERFGIPNAAIERYQHVLDNYPGYPRKDEVLYHQCRAYVARRAPGDVALGRGVCDRLREEYPESEYVAKIPEKWPEERQLQSPKEIVDAKKAAEKGAEEAAGKSRPTPEPVGSDDGV